jgi:hypothetical protein
MGAADEIVVIVDAHNQVVGAAPRREMRALQLPHRSTYVLVFNSQGELYVQKRTLTKDVFPGYFDVAAGGVVLAGETYEQGAERELEEEMGIRSIPLNRLFEFILKTNTHGSGAVPSPAYMTVGGPRRRRSKRGVRAGERHSAPGRNGALTPDGMYVLQRYLNGRE